MDQSTVDSPTELTSIDEFLCFRVDRKRRRARVGGRAITPGGPHDRDFHLARVVAGLPTRISPDSARRLARLLRPDPQPPT